MSALDEKPFPRGALLGAAALIFATVAGVGYIQIGKANGTIVIAKPAQAEVIAQRDLKVTDAGDGLNAFGGGVVVYDATSGAEIAKLEATDGFVRVVLNALAFERTRKEAGEAVYRLVLRADRAMSLEDIGTGVSINLGAFGPENKSRFMRFLPPLENQRG